MNLLRPDPSGQRWLGAVIAGLCFIACLAAVGAGAATRAAHGWAGRLSAEATVQVRPRVGETGPSAACPTFPSPCWSPSGWTARRPPAP